MVSGIYWSRGAREQNEDSLALEEVCTNRGKCTLLVVCDGIATLEHGEVASGYVVECLVKWFYSYGIHMGNFHRRNIPRLTRRIIERSLRKVILDAHINMRGKRMGTTCCAVVIWGNTYVCMNIGDSGACIVGDGCRRITEADRNKRGELTKAISGVRFDKPDFSFGRIGKGQGILVASDGFLDGMIKNGLVQMLYLDGEVDRVRLEKRLAAVGTRIAECGGTDNRSVVMAVR